MTTPVHDSKYLVWRVPRTLTSCTGLISENTSTYAKGLSYCGWDMNSCGVASIQGFNNTYPEPHTFPLKADLIATLYRECYNAGHTIYALASNQLYHPLHLALKEMGATQIAEFPNLFHGPERMSIWLVNIRDAVGMYCNEYGEPYTEPSKEPWKPSVHVRTSAYQYLPKRPAT